jgi:uncharacterized protein involved in exopolysaccharide biosynthesis
MQSEARDLGSGQPGLAALQALFRHRWLFATLSTAVIVLVAVMTLTAKRQYQSEMKFLLENNRSNAVITADRSAAPALAEITEQQINSELEVINSEDVLGAVADPDWASLPVAWRRPAAMKDHQEKMDTFRRRLKVGLAHKSNVIDVSYVAPSSLEATETLERFSAAYLAHRKHLSRPSGTSKFFVDEANRYRDAWQKANGELVAFQQQNQLVSVQETEQSLSKEITGEEDDLRANETSLAEARMQLIAGSEAAGKVPERQQTQQHTLFSQSSVDQMRTLLVNLQNRKTELLTRYAPTDRLVLEVNRQMLDTSASLQQAQSQKGQEDTTDVNPAWQQVKSMLVEGTINREALKARGQSLRGSLADLRRQLARLQSLDVRYNALQEQADQARSNFEVFSEKRDQAQIEDAMDERKLINIAVAQSPTSSFLPVSPKPLLNVALGLLTALFLGAGAVYFAEASRGTVANARELEMASRYPVLATVPYAAEMDDAPASRTPSASWAPRRTAKPLSARQMVAAMRKLNDAEKA